jgi:hypothetical protein
MGTLRIPGKKTLALEVARRCLDLTPDYSGHAPKHISVQTADSGDEKLFWVNVPLFNEITYFIQGEVKDWDNPDQGGTCEVNVVVVNTYVKHLFEWQMVNFKIEVTFIETQTS